MNKLIKIAAVVAMISACVLTSGCNPVARQFGGTVHINLKENQKLINCGWKTNDSLWILTRPMREDEKPETYTYQEDSTFGVLEGTVIIQESR